jgi:hypothetical protein
MEANMPQMGQIRDRGLIPLCACRGDSGSSEGPSGCGTAQFGLKRKLGGLFPAIALSPWFPHTEAPFSNGTPRRTGVPGKKGHVLDGSGRLRHTTRWVWSRRHRRPNGLKSSIRGWYIDRGRVMES